MIETIKDRLKEAKKSIEKMNGYVYKRTSFKISEYENNTNITRKGFNCNVE